MPDTRADPPHAHAWPTFAHNPATPPACASADPDLFHPTTERANSDVHAAKTICRRCPVKTACLDFAIDTGQTHGVWGGHTTAERRTIAHRRHQGLPDHPPGAAP